MALSNAERCRLWREKQDPEKLKEGQAAAQRKYIEKIGIDKHRERAALSSQRWRKKNPEHRRKLDRAQNLKKYGLTSKSYKELHDKQNARCACCGLHVSEQNQRLSVDHCHETNVVRGLLCSNCNTGIGKLGDNVEGLTRAINYLSSQEKRET